MNNDRGGATFSVELPVAARGDDPTAEVTPRLDRLDRSSGPS
jgi:hypothetical protein